MGVIRTCELCSTWENTSWSSGLWLLKLFERPAGVDFRNCGLSTYRFRMLPAQSKKIAGSANSPEDSSVPWSWGRNGEWLSWGCCERSRVVSPRPLSPGHCPRGEKLSSRCHFLRWHLDQNRHFLSRGTFCGCPPAQGVFSSWTRHFSFIFSCLSRIIFERFRVLVSALVQVSQVDIRHVGPSGRSSAASSRHPLFQQIPAVYIRFWTSSATINPETMKPESV